MSLGGDELRPLQAGCPAVQASYGEMALGFRGRRTAVEAGGDPMGWERASAPNATRCRFHPGEYSARGGHALCEGRSDVCIDVLTDCEDCETLGLWMCVPFVPAGATVEARGKSPSSAPSRCLLV